MRQGKLPTDKEPIETYNAINRHHKRFTKYGGPIGCTVKINAKSARMTFHKDPTLYFVADWSIASMTWRLSRSKGTGNDNGDKLTDAQFATMLDKLVRSGMID